MTKYGDVEIGMNEPVQIVVLISCAVFLRVRSLIRQVTSAQKLESNERFEETDAIIAKFEVSRAHLDLELPLSWIIMVVWAWDLFKVSISPSFSNEYDISRTKTLNYGVKSSRAYTISRENRNGHIQKHFLTLSIPGTWGNIVKSIKELENFRIHFNEVLNCHVGNGNKTFFWLEDCYGGGCFGSRFHYLLKLDTKHSCLISDRISMSAGLSWSWKKSPECRLNQWNSITSRMQMILENPNSTLMESDPRSHSDRYGSLTQRCSYPLDGMPPLLHSTDSTDHILAGCSFTREVLFWIFKWCDVPLPDFNTIKEITDFVANWGRCPKKRAFLVAGPTLRGDRLVAIVYGLLRNAWKVRNDKLFNNVHCSPNKMADIIISTVFNWVKSRGNFGVCNWTNWLCCPFKTLSTSGSSGALNTLAIFSVGTNGRYEETWYPSSAVCCTVSLYFSDKKEAVGITTLATLRNNGILFNECQAAAACCSATGSYFTKSSLAVGSIFVYAVFANPDAVSIIPWLLISVATLLAMAFVTDSSTCNSFNFQVSWIKNILIYLTIYELEDVSRDVMEGVTCRADDGFESTLNCLYARVGYKQQCTLSTTTECFMQRIKDATASPCKEVWVQKCRLNNRQHISIKT
ncbi:hypothetical protein LXL04_038919 [Taraxacum kok-saghyz]